MTDDNPSGRRLAINLAYRGLATTWFLAHLLPLR